MRLFTCLCLFVVGGFVVGCGGKNNSPPCNCSPEAVKEAVTKNKAAAPKEDECCSKKKQHDSVLRACKCPYCSCGDGKECVCSKKRCEENKCDCNKWKKETPKVKCNCIYCSCEQGDECTCNKEKCDRNGCKCNKWEKDEKKKD